MKINDYDYINTKFTGEEEKIGQLNPTFSQSILANLSPVRELCRIQLVSWNKDGNKSGVVLLRYLIKTNVVSFY